jgi:putative phosphoesterase
MKIAVLSDIHANYPALLAVSDHISKWQPDLVFMAGDIVNRGPRPLECLNFVLDKQKTEDWRVIRGNHEDYVLFHDSPEAPDSGVEFELLRSSNWTYRKLNADVSTLEKLPFKSCVKLPDAGEFRVAHASMRSNRVGIFPFTSDEELQQLIEPPPAVFCVGHTHRPLIRKLNDTLVVNAGSAGLPFDGDNRVSYTQVTWHRENWQAKIIRLPYDMGQAERDFFDTGFIQEGGPVTELMLVELRLAYSQLYQWTARYRNPVLRGELSVEKSIREYLEQPNTQYV